MFDEILEAAKVRVADKKSQMPIERLEALMEFMPIPIPGNPPGTGAYQTFQEALTRKGLSIIAEIKEGNPGKDPSSTDISYLDIAEDCERGDADAICYVTEPHWFLGSNEAFSEIRTEVSTPMLYKDFIVDPYQIYEAKNLGADAVVLMCGALDDDALRKCLRTCNDLYIDALVEAHDDEEVLRAVNSNALIIGIGNRDLTSSDGEIADIETLRKLIPDDCVFVIDSGIANVEDAKRAREMGADAVIVKDLVMDAGSPEERQDILRQLTEID